MKLAFSPCPNDTFIFDALVHGRVPGAPVVEVTYADIDVLNKLATAGVPDVVKVSAGALPWLLEDYRVLPSGGALGRGCGPLVLVASPDRTDLEGAVVAVPGERTTAYLLFRLWAADQGVKDVVVLPFEQIMPAVQRGDVDAGLVIHESRFTYPSYGLRALQDLGEWWESTTGLPIPLGLILARRDNPDFDALGRWIAASVEQAWADPALSAPYVAEYSQEMDPGVCQQHIDLYVNSFSADLGTRAGARSRRCCCGRPRPGSSRRSTRPPCADGRSQASRRRRRPATSSKPACLK